MQTFLYFNALGLEHFPQPHDLFLELSDEFGVGVFIDHSFANNLFGTICIPVQPNTKRMFQIYVNTTGVESEIPEAQKIGSEIPIIANLIVPTWV